MQISNYLRMTLEYISCNFFFSVQYLSTQVRATESFVLSMLLFVVVFTTYINANNILFRKTHIIDIFNQVLTCANRLGNESSSTFCVRKKK